MHGKRMSEVQLFLNFNIDIIRELHGTLCMKVFRKLLVAVFGKLAKNVRCCDTLANEKSAELF